MIIHEMQQGSDAWHDIRRGLVTASNFATATAGGTGKIRKDLMIKLIAERMTGLSQDSYSNKAMGYGSETESAAREYYEALNGVSVRQVGFVQRDEDAGCSPDGLVGNPGMTEIKCPDSTTHIKTLLAGKMPTRHFKQVQGGLWVCEREWCDFVSFDHRMSKRMYFCQRVYRDEKAIKELHIGIVQFLTEMNVLMDKLTKPAF